MTGIVLKDASANYRDAALGWAGCPIDAAGLEMAFFFGGTLARSLKNYAPGKPNAVAVGTPGVTANGLTLQGGTNYLQTSMADSWSMTLISIYRVKADVDVMVIANTVGTATPSQRKTAIYCSSETAGDGLVQLNALHASDTASQTAVVGSLAVDSYVCTAMRFDSVEQIVKSKNLTSGVTHDQPVSGTRTAGSPLRIGWGYMGGYTGVTDVVAAIGFSRKLTDAELASFYAYLKTYAARRSIAI